MSRHILLIQDDAAAAKTILDALSNSSDESFQVEWVRCCSEVSNDWLAAQRYWLTCRCPTAAK